ncbi:MAG: L-rhamnose mutarotase [Reichenbachiella sp.]|uniref:L-rhamnose mutarotase n=1 Tax=Reichenbachiella sp. TaxID=2184521 RepID=UPI0032673FB9
MKLTRYCLALDLIDNPELISAYEESHKKVWPEVITNIKNAGIEHLELYRVENRLMMVMEVNDTFSFDRKAEMDESNEQVQEWERLMWKYQQALPNTKPGEKWRLMKNIFSME